MDMGKGIESNLKMRLSNAETSAKTMLNTGVYQGFVQLIEGFSKANRSLISFRR